MANSETGGEGGAGERVGGGDSYSKKAIKKGVIKIRCVKNLMHEISYHKFTISDEETRGYYYGILILGVIDLLVILCQRRLSIAVFSLLEMNWLSFRIYWIYMSKNW